jgi:Tol biopolymer transport system component
MRILAALAIAVLVTAALWPRSSTPPEPPGSIAFTSYAALTDPVMGPLLDNVPGSIVIWRKGKTTTILSPGQWESYDSPAWSPDGATIAVGHGVACMTCSPPESILVDQTGIREGSFLDSKSPAWLRGGRAANPVSPDGRWVAYAAGDELLVARRTGGKGFVLARCPRRCAQPAWRPARSR